MSREKRLVKAFAIGTGVLLLICTVAAQIIYQRMLPRVQEVETYWQGTGFVLPQEALFAEPQGMCVYCIEEKQDRFGTKYLVKAVLVTVEEQNIQDGTVTVRGIYDDRRAYAANADTPLADGTEVKVVP